MTGQSSASSQSAEEYGEWDAFVAKRARGELRAAMPWVAVSGREIVGQFASHDEAADELVRLGNGNPDGSVFHIDDQPVNLQVCRFARG